MKKSIIISVLAVILVAGCVGEIPFIPIPSTFIGGNGLTIIEFSVEPSEVYGGSSARVIVEVENKGGALVEEEKGFVMLIGSALDLDGDEDMYWTSDTETSVYKHFGKDMKPADPVRETPSDTKRLSWSLKAPDIDAGQVKEDIFIGRVYYDYETTVSGTIWIYSQDEADAARAAGRAMRSSTFTSTAGPVGVEVKTSPDPVVVEGDGETFVLTIKLSSVGGGTLYKAGGVTYTDGSENEEITEDELNWVNVDIAASPSILTIPGECEGDQELVGGKDVTITCDVTVINEPATFQGVPLTVTASYGYFTERTVSVSVSGR
jgi:hypothetical protein